MGVKRALSASFYPGRLDSYATASSWLDTPDRPDYVDRNDETDQNPVSTGCAVLFLNHLPSQLMIPRIVQAGGTTLGETYTNLGLGVDGLTEFRSLIDVNFPRETQPADQR